MNPEALDKRVTLQQHGTTQDNTGAEIPGWTNVITTGDGKVWAQKRDMSGRQYIAAKAERNSVITEWKIRRRNGIEAKMRLLEGGDIYDIEAVLADGKDWLVLMCVKGLSNG
jgi:SPP1 family predicted phage head-tail adaptor